MTVEERIAELQKQIDELKAEVKNGNGVFNRVPLNGCYYSVTTDCGEAKSTLSHEINDYYDNKRFENNNYFRTEERAKEVAEKINALLKLERIYDTLCPEYKPDWNNEGETKCKIGAFGGNDEVLDSFAYSIKSFVETYFPKDKIEEAIKLYKEIP